MQINLAIFGYLPDQIIKNIVMKWQKNVPINLSKKTLGLIICLNM